VKAWSRREQDEAFLARLFDRAAVYERGLVRDQAATRRSVGAFLFERGEPVHKHTTGDLSLSGYETNPLFHNLGGRFVNLSTALGTGLTDDARGVVAMDLDRDGDPDLVVHNVYRPQLVALRNDLGRGRTLAVSLRGVKTNRFGVGARVVAHVGGRAQAQEMACGSGYLSCQPLELVFGLGDAAAAERVEVFWPSGRRDVLSGVKPGRVTVEEGRGAVAHVPHVPPAAVPAAAPERVAREGDRFVLAADALDGTPFDASTLAGRPLAVNFWSRYCTACESEVGQYPSILPELKRVDARFEILSVNIDGEPSEMRSAQTRLVAARAQGRGFVPSHDPAVPLTLIVGADGIIRARHVGALTPEQFGALARRSLK